MITLYGFSIMKEPLEKAIFITHDQKEALEIGDRIAVLNQGRIEQIGIPYDVYNKPETEYVATFLGIANLLLGVIRNEKFKAENISLEIQDESKLRDGQSVKLVFRPEDVFFAKTGEINAKLPETD